MSLFRITLACFLIASTVTSYGQVNYGITIDGKYYNSDQLDSILFAKEVDEIVKNLSTSRQSVNRESHNNITKEENKFKDPTLEKASRTIFNLSAEDAAALAPGDPAPLVEIKAPEYFWCTRDKL